MSGGDSGGMSGSGGCLVSWVGRGGRRGRNVCRRTVSHVLLRLMVDEGMLSGPVAEGSIRRG